MNLGVTHIMPSIAYTSFSIKKLPLMKSNKYQVLLRDIISCNAVCYALTVNLGVYPSKNNSGTCRVTYFRTGGYHSDLVYGIFQTTNLGTVDFPYINLQNVREIKEENCNYVIGGIK